LILTLLLPLHRNITNENSEEDPKETSVNSVQHFRRVIRSLTTPAMKRLIGPLKRNKGFSMVEYVMQVPRRPNLWKEWGLCDEELSTSNDGDIEVVVIFPDSLLPKNVSSDPDNLPKTPLGCISVQSFDLSALPEDVEVVVFLHGGGLLLSEARDKELVQLYVDFLEATSKKGHKESVFLSIEYSLAPEHPFPAAPLEVMTVMTHLIEAHPNRSFHLCGISAGAYLAAVTTLELHRHFPGRISSSLIVCPMVEPAADSLSYYQNAKSSAACPVSFLRRGWQFFLGLPQDGQDATESKTAGSGTTASMDTADIVTANIKPSTMDSLLAHGSNRTAWNRSQWKGTKLERVIRPLADPPVNLGTRCVIATNRGDPLKDEGVALAAKLQDIGGLVQHLDFRGSHWLGITLDSQNYQTLVEALVDLVFHNKKGLNSAADADQTNADKLKVE
jgi:acetyl esterase/lipase